MQSFDKSTELGNRVESTNLELPRPLQTFTERNLSRLNRGIVSLVRDRIQEDFSGFRVAKFSVNGYTASYEAALRKLGADYLELSSAEGTNHEVFTAQRGYFELPTQVSWNGKAVLFDEHIAGMPSKNRNRLQSKLRKSNELKVKVEEINPKNFAKWHRIYEAEVVNRPRGISRIKSDWAQTQNTKNHRLIGYYNSQNEMIGGAVVLLSKKELTAVIGYAAYSAEFRSAEMPVRTFAETLKLANRFSLPRISHGWEHNMYGHHLNVGLMEFKAGLGLNVQAGKDYKIIKVLNPVKFRSNAFDGNSDNELVFFSIDPVSEKSACHYFSSGTHRKLVLPAYLPCSLNSFEDFPPVDFGANPYQSPAELIKGVHSFEQAKELAKTTASSHQAKRLMELAVEEHRDAVSHSFMVNVNESLGGVGSSYLYLIDGLRMNNFFREPLSALDPDEYEKLEDPKIIRQLAGYLEQGFNRMSCDILFPEVLDRLFGDTSIYEYAPISPRDSYYITCFEGIREKYGLEALQKFVNELHLCLNFKSFLSDSDKYPEARRPPPEPSLTLEDLQLEKYVSPNKLRSAKVLVEEIYKLYIHHGVSNYGTGDRIVTTIGGAHIATILHFFDDPDSFIKELEKDRPKCRSDYKNKIQDCYESLRSLLKRKNVKPECAELARVCKDFRSVAGFSSPHTIKFLFYLAGLDPKDLKIVGSKKDDTIEQLALSLSAKDRERFVRFVEAEERDLMDRSHVYGLRVSLPALQALNLSPDVIFPKLAFEPDAVLEAHFAIYNFIRMSYPHREMFARKLLSLLDLNDLPLPDNGFCFDSETNLILVNYMERFSKLPEFGKSEAESLLFALSKEAKDAAPISKWFVSNPDRVPSEEMRLFIAEGFGNSGIHGRGWDDIAMALYLLKFEDTKDKALGLLKSTSTFEFTDTFMDVRQMGNMTPMLRYLSKLTLSEVERSLATEELFGILDRCRMYAEENLNGFSSIYKNVKCLGIMLKLVVGDSERLLNYFQQVAESQPDICLNFISNTIGPNVTESPNYQSVRTLLFTSINNLDKMGGEVKTCSYTDTGRTYIKWDRESGLQVTKSAVNWMLQKVDFIERRSELPLDVAELSNFVKWVWQNPSEGALNVAQYRTLKLIAAIKDKSLRMECIEQVLGSLRKFPAVDLQIFYKDCLAMQDAIDLNGENAFISRAFESVEFIRNYAWTNLGYDEKVSARVHAFAEQAECTLAVPGNLANLLFQQGINNHYWVTQLILSTPARSFVNMLPLLTYARCLGDGLDEYVSSRLDEITSETRYSLFQKIKNNAIEKLDERIKFAKEQGSEAELEQLTQERDRFANLSQLFNIYAEELSPERRSMYLKKITACILEYYPPKLNPQDEMSNLIKHVRGGFLEIVKKSYIEPEIIESFINNNLIFLEQSGILERLVSFNTITGSEGVVMLNTLLAVLANHEEARMVSLNRPDLSGKKSQNIDLFRKFNELDKTLGEYGLPDKQREELMEVWRKLWVFVPVRNKTDTWLSVTHDLERWIKHGEEPKRSCHSLIRKSGEMEKSNWNYKYGATVSESGRSLARSLLPQLKLAEFRSKGVLLARCVLEITIQKDRINPKPWLLVEGFYSSDTFSQGEEFKESIREFAATMGISSDSITFSDENKALTGEYPEPLPEKFRIYRDTYRTTYDVEASIAAQDS